MLYKENTDHLGYIFNTGGSVWGLDWCPIIGKGIFIYNDLFIYLLITIILVSYLIIFVLMYICI